MKASLPYLLLIALAVLACTVDSKAQSAPGTVTVTGKHGGDGTCPSHEGFGSRLTCYDATVTNCPNTDSISLVFGYASPSSTPNGLVVFLSGAGGTAATVYPGGDGTFAQSYYNNNYNIVQLAWSYDWELTNAPGNSSHAASILSAACRQAAFLYWARYNTASNNNGPVVFPTTQQNSQAGMCVQGFSAGSAATAYSLAYYGAASYVDKVELLSGPVFSDIAQGCAVPAGPNVNICGGSPSYCYGWPSGGQSEAPTYVFGTEKWLQSWTGNAKCAGGSPTNNSDKTGWLDQSIVNNPNGGATFSYPQTMMSAWLCTSDTDGTYNESAPEGWLFYNQIGGSGTLAPFQVTAVSNCSGPEGVTGGTVNNGTQHATDAITADMSTSTNKCIKNAGH